MTLFTVRRTVATASMALIAATLATPASAHELDEDAIATKICGPGVNPDGSEYWESAESGDEAQVDLYSYGVGENEAGDPVTLCTFAIISTDEDTSLDGNYTLSVGSLAPVTGTVTGTDAITKPILSSATERINATIKATGTQSSPKSVKQKKAAKAAYDKSAKAAKATYNKVVKAAKAKYAKAGKTSKAKKVMAKKIAAAKKKYQAALAKATATKKRQSSPTERSFSLDLAVPLFD